MTLLEYDKLKILLPNDLGLEVFFTLSRISDQRGPTFVKEFFDWMHSLEFDEMNSL